MRHCDFLTKPFRNFLFIEIVYSKRTSINCKDRHQQQHCVIYMKK